MNKTITKVQNESNVKALRRARELRKLSRTELGARLGTTNKAVEFYENGRFLVSQEKVESILSALDFTWEQFMKIKKGKTPFARVREVKVIKNQDRRSYQKNITKECKVLRSLRREKGISQDQASTLCGYSRPTIGHIENGRIELDQKRIQLIVKSYGFKMDRFNQDLLKGEQRDEVVDMCAQVMGKLDNAKLEMIRNLLLSL